MREPQSIDLVRAAHEKERYLEGVLRELSTLERIAELQEVNHRVEAVEAQRDLMIKSLDANDMKLKGILAPQSSIPFDLNAPGGYENYRNAKAKECEIQRDQGSFLLNGLYVQLTQLTKRRSILMQSAGPAMQSLGIGLE